MPNFLGSDFNPAQPSDDDLAKYGARWVRDIKQRIKNAFGVLFDLETGQLQDKSIDPSKLKDLNPDPSGTWNTVTVDTNGLVLSGQSVQTPVSAKINRWTFFVDHRIDNTDAVFTDGVADATDNQTVYNWSVPDGVNAIRVKLLGGTNGNDPGGSSIDAVVLVAPGDVWVVRVGKSAVAPLAGGYSKVYFSPSKYLSVSVLFDTSGINNILSLVKQGQPGDNGYILIECWQ